MKTKILKIGIILTTILLVNFVQTYSQFDCPTPYNPSEWSPAHIDLQEFSTCGGVR